MYHGEVNVCQEDLNSFLAVAEELQVKGLTNKEQAESAAIPVMSAAPKIRPVPVRIKEPSGPPLKRPRKLSPPRVVATADKEDNDGSDGDVKEIIKVKTDPDVDAVVVVHPDEEGYDDSYGEYYGDDGELEGDGTEDDPTAGGSADGGKGRSTVCSRFLSFFHPEIFRNCSPLENPVPRNFLPRFLRNSADFSREKSFERSTPGKVFRANNLQRHLSLVWRGCAP
jgi:hypothetical protein